MKSLLIIAIVAMIGTIIVQEAYAVEEVMEEETKLTINSFEVYEDADYTRYRVTGDSPESTNITFQTIKPDGSSGNFAGDIDTSKPAYIVDNKIDPTNSMVYGTWTLEVCAPEYDMCVQEVFIIDKPDKLPDDETTQTVVSNEESAEEGGGCLIATATYGSEMALEVQQLRELRDNQLLNTESGTAFMGTFNDIYYSFSPIIADMQRENPVFKEVVKLAITPMISSLSILNYVDMNSESEVLGYGISLILLNLGMYLGVPAVVIIGIRKRPMV